MDDTNAGSSLLTKGRGFFASLKRRDAEAVRDVDEVVAGILKFIRTGGGDVLDGKQTLALLTKTARHVNAKHREHLRHSDVSEEERPYAEALEEITSFFSKLNTIRFKSDPDQPPGEELSEINLELFPSLTSLQVSGVTIIHVKCGGTVTHLIFNNHAKFAPGISVFPSCTHLEVDEADPLDIVKSIQGSLSKLSLTSCDVTSLLPVLADLCPNLKELSLSGCGLDAVPEGISRLTKLESLVLSGNPIPAVAHIRDLPLLKHLDMSGCALMSIEALTHEGESTSPLVSLDISQNPLMLLQGVGPWHRSMTCVNVTGCAVSDWGQEIARFARLPALTALDLQQNPAYTVSPELQKGPRQLVIELLSDIEDPCAFVLDGEQLSKAEVKHWQETFKNTARMSPVVEGDTGEWPEAVGPIEPATLVMSDDSPMKGKAVKKKIKTRTVKQVSHQRVTTEKDGEVVVRMTKKKVEDKGITVGVVGVEKEIQVGGTTKGMDDIPLTVLHKVGERLGHSQYAHVRTDTYADWGNGLGLMALLHSCDSAWVAEFHNLSTADNLDTALRLAETHLAVPYPTIGPSVMAEPLVASSYIALVLLEIQSWESQQYRKLQNFTKTLTDEIDAFRKQRAVDRKVIRRLQSGDEYSALNRSVTHSDSVMDSDGDTESDYYSS